ncbi:MAG TPA: HAMP domain-containing protein [Candidatus Caccousia avicola]|uniref:HAMP domain-containing protein n=1 Tax=Candidatus Caccousia avicola TaxID=2840721 RepID=A0A9D1AMA4_9FIRM|nr:HAMP domain-containing protein [Candidatus Caccousia avicola]
MKQKQSLRNTVRFGVKTKILIPVIVVNVIVCATLGIFLERRMQNTATELAAELALSAAQSTADSIDPSDLLGLQEGDETTDTYQRVAAAMDSARAEAGVLYAYTLTTDGTNVYYGVEAAQEEPEPIGSVFEEDYASLEQVFLGEELLDTTIYHTEDGILISCYVPIFDEDGNVVSIMGCDYDAQEIANKNRTNTIVVIFCTLMGLMLLTVVTILNLNHVLRPLVSTTEIAARLRACDLSPVKDVTYSKDEIGELTHTFVAMQNGLRELIHDIRYQLGEMSRGNYCVESGCAEQYKGAYLEILRALTGIRKEMNHTIRNISVASSQVSEGTTQIAVGAQRLSDDNVKQAASVEEISEAVKNIVKEINATAQGAKDAVALSGEAAASVEKSNCHMQALAVAIQEIAEKSGQINNIIQTIDSIAFQTNLLALNAAVEAARAGNAGKGFAVVADEVRALAQRSAEAAQTTSALIKDTISAVEKSLKLAEQTEDALQTVVGCTSRTQEKACEISDACSRQVDSTEQVNSSISHISGVVQENSALAQETAATCEQLSTMAKSMDSMIKRFKVMDESAVSFPV